MCGSRERRLLLTNLRDVIFFVAPGAWDLFECTECKSSYLDPRPTPETIHIAYSNYYTHVPAWSDKKENITLSLLQKFRLQIELEYISHRYGGNFRSRLPLTRLAIYLLLRRKRAVDARYRFMPKPTSGFHLLDVGFGGGGYLLLAQECGWQVSGIDSDLEVVRNAKNKGLNVKQGAFDEISGQSEKYDAITMSHVIEHMHDPVRAINQAYDLLRPRGKVFIETPNIESYGLRIYGRHWRGLEVPRHITLFSMLGLRRELIRAGFVKIEFHSRNVGRSMFLKSEKIMLGLDPYDETKLKLGRFRKIIALLGGVRPRRAEFLTVVAQK
ncbi:MAG: class I SAM-dependent methyltransferase [Pseudomonadales bacterium]